MTLLDEHERLTLTEFLHLMEQEAFEPRPKVEKNRIFRGADGQIIVPVVLSAEEPSLSLAMLMAHKAEHLYKQTGCRFVLAQRLEQDPQNRLIVWAEGSWKSLP